MSSDLRKYSLRPHAPPTGESSLERGLRVFMAPADMAHEGLSQGDFISIQSESTGTAVIAIISRATDNIGGGHKGLGNPVIRISEYLRACSSLELKDRCTIQKWSGRRIHVSSITLTNVADNKPHKTNIDPEALEDWTKSALKNLEGIYVNGTFEVTPQEQGERRRRQRFLVEHIEPPQADKELMIPYYFDHRSKVKFRHMDSPLESPLPQVLRPLEFNFDGLSGIDKELEKLQDTINYGVMLASVPMSSPTLVLGSSGTGKTSVLKCLSSANWNKVFTLKSSIISPVASKTEANLAKFFEDVSSHEPSLVIIDDMEIIAGKESLESATALSEYMQIVKDRRVQIVATARRRTDLNERIVHWFDQMIHLTIPNLQGRFQILQDLAGQRCEVDVLRRISEKTHAFSAPDLRSLWKEAFQLARIQAYEAASSATPKSEETFVSGKELNEIQPTDTWAQVMDEHFEDSLKHIHASAMNEVYVEVPRVQWSDIGGSDNVKKYLNQTIRHGSYGSNNPFRVLHNRGILLYGPPGCSKTLLVKAFATESKLNFLSVKGPQLFSKFVGDTEHNIRETFRKARAASPCVIFFDEFDAMARRDTGHESLSPVTALLAEMDGIEGLSDVLILAATNRPQVIDKALLRPGRFGMSIYVGPPNEDARRQIIEINLKDRPVARKSIDLEELTNRTAGWSGAEVAELCNIAAVHAHDEWFEDRTKTVLIGGRHFEAAFKEIKPMLSRDMLSELESWTVKGIDKAIA